jgi:hypothetical protein
VSERKYLEYSYGGHRDLDASEVEEMVDSLRQYARKAQDEIFSFEFVEDIHFIDREMGKSQQRGFYPPSLISQVRRVSIT